MLRLTGYDLNLDKIVKQEFINGIKKYYVESKTEKKYIPNFLVDDESDEDKLHNLILGLKIVGDYLEKSILKPNNINYPVDRLNFINSLKQLS